jgi:hypothetical protein
MPNIILLLCIAFSVVDTAAADTITLSVQGTLSNVIFTPLGFPIAIGDPFRLDITFNPPRSSELTVFHPEPGVEAVIMEERRGSSSLTVGGNLLDPYMLGYVVASVRNDTSSEGNDELVIFFDKSPSSPEGFSYGIRGDGPGDWLSTAEWPTDLAAALNSNPGDKSVGMSYGGDNPEAFAIGSFTRVTQTPAPVPEPTTLLLLSSGMVGVAGARRWRQRNR